MRTIDRPARRPSHPVEPLEARRLMHGAVDLAFNFGPKGVPGVAGLIADTGEVYGDQGNGMTFGWNAYNAANGRDRNILEDQRLDTFTHLQREGNRVWELALPNGEYTVTVTAGDALFFDSVNIVNVEGLNVVKSTPTAANPFATRTRIVNVTDGKLTMRAGGSAVNAKVNSIRIQSSHEGGEDPGTTVSTEIIDSDVDEGTANPGLVRLSRTGDASASLVVALAWSGAGGNTRDLTSPLPASVTFAAGQTIIDLPIVARADSLAERAEAVWIEVKAGAGYAPSTGAAAVATIDGQAGALRDIAWTTGTSSPTPHTEAQVAVVDGRMYRFGGYNGNYAAVRRVERFDPATGAWVRYGDMPRGLSHAGTAVVGAKVYFAGAFAERVGSPGQQDIGIDTVYIYDSLTDTWSTGPNLPEARGSGNLANVGGVLYFMGGETPGRVDTATVWSLDTRVSGATWVTRASMPEVRTHFGVGVVGGKIYIFGGQTNRDANGVPLKTAYVYDPAANAWTRRADMPTPMSHLAPGTVVYKDKIYSFGGDNPVYTVSAQAREYDPASNTWRLLTNIPSARSAVCAAVIGDTFYLNGGKSRTAEWTSDFFVGSVVL